MSTLIPQLIVLCFLLFLSGFFSGAETALFSLNSIERRRLMEKHPFIGRTAEALLLRSRRTLITILIGNMIINTAASTIATIIAIRFFGDFGVALTIIFFTFVLLLVGEIMPKIFAIRNNVLIAEFSAVPLNFLAKITFPLRYVIRHIADWVLAFLVKGHHPRQDLMSEDELKALVKIGEEDGVLNRDEVKMISRLIDFGERSVKEIMTPRINFVAFNIKDNREKLVEFIQKSQFSHIPVYEETVDNMLGVISTQEFMLDTQNRLRELIQQPYFIPETKKMDELLLELRQKNQSVAFCVDEHGAIVGLVTFEDIVEEIFGEFHDEYAKLESSIKEVAPDEYSVQAKISLREVNERLSLNLSSESSETLNGWLLEKLGRIPTYNEVFSFENLEFRIIEVFQRRIVKVTIRKKK